MKPPVTAKPRIGILLATTRPARFADIPARWLLDLARRRGDTEFEIVDLPDHPMPFFEEEQSPMFVPPHDKAALRWAKKMAGFDGYVFVIPEYSRGIPAVLKNARDYADAERITAHSQAA